MYAKLIEWGIKYVLPGLLVAGLVAYGTYQAYDFGRDVERGEWAEKQHLAEVAHRFELEVLADAAELAVMAHQLKLEEIRNAKKDAVAKLEHDVAVVSARGLFVIAKSCDPGEAEAVGTSGSGSGASRTRLPEATERDLISLAEDADKVVFQYLGCRSELLEHVEVMD